MPANLENSAVTTGLEKVSFHYNLKERQCQRMFTPPHNCTHLTHEQNNAPNSPSQASTVRELKTSRCLNWIQKRQRNQRSNCQHLLDHRKSKIISEKHLLLLHWLHLSFLAACITTNCGKLLTNGNNRAPYLSSQKPVLEDFEHDLVSMWNEHKLR